LRVLWIASVAIAIVIAIVVATVIVWLPVLLGSIQARWIIAGWWQPCIPPSAVGLSFDRELGRELIEITVAIIEAAII
jgi:hypothetical protein